MRKIDKSENEILSTGYKKWVDKLNEEGKIHSGNYYYKDVAVNLYKCQFGVCAYTEMHLCRQDFYKSENWENGRYKLPAECIDLEHFGQMDHFDPDYKNTNYWSWDNLFMINASINSTNLKGDNPVIPYLKPDLEDYTPEKYFQYDYDTNLFTPNVKDKNANTIAEIQYMIDHVLFLNHAEVKYARKTYIHSLFLHKEYGVPYAVDQFFTSVKWTIGL